MAIGQNKIFREIDLVFDSTSFFGLDFSKFSGSLCITRNNYSIYLRFHKKKKIGHFLKLLKKLREKEKSWGQESDVK